MSILEVIAVLYRSKRGILVAGAFVGLVAVLPIISKRKEYSATALFAPASGADPRSNLASVAGQFGVSIPVSSAGFGQSPQFYVDLIGSRVILANLVDDTVRVAEQGNARIPIRELLGFASEPPARSDELAVEALASMIKTSIHSETGVVALTVTTPWPSVSRQLGDEVLRGLNNFNLHTRQTQATEERRFVEGRLETARGELRAAEDRLQQFLQNNRDFSRSPALTFDHERLDREVNSRQQVFNSLAQAFEDVRIREVRDTPVLIILQAPVVSTRPNARGRILRALIGFLVGASFFAALIFIAATLSHRQRQGDPDAERILVAARRTRLKIERLLSRRPASGSGL